MSVITGKWLRQFIFWLAVWGAVATYCVVEWWKR